MRSRSGPVDDHPHLHVTAASDQDAVNQVARKYPVFDDPGSRPEQL